MGRFTIITTINIIILFFFTTFALSTSANSPNSHGGLTTEIYLAPEQYIPSSEPNTLSVNDGEVAIILDNGTKVNIENSILRAEISEDASVQSSSPSSDIYLTIVYSPVKHKIYFYNHGKKISALNLGRRDLNFFDFIHYLKNKYKSDEITYLKNTSNTLTRERVKKSYKRNYEKIKQEIEKTIRYQVVTKTWDGGGIDNNWNTAANWNGDTAPGAGDHVVFDATNTKNCTINVAINQGDIMIAAGYTGIITQSAGITVTGTSFSQAAGTFTGGNSTIDINGAFSVTAGTFTSTTGDLQISGGFTHSGGTFTHNSGTVTLDGATQATLDNAVAGTTFNNLTINKTSGTDPDVTVSAGDTFTVAGTFTWTDGDIDGSGTIDVTGATVSIAATSDGHTTTASNLKVSGGATACTFNAGSILSNVELNTASTCSTAGVGTVTVQGNFTLTMGTLTGSTQNLDVDGTLTLTAGTFTAPSVNLNIGGNWTSTVANTIFMNNSGTVIFDGTGAQTADVATSETFNALTINKSDATVLTVSAGDSLIANGDFTWTNGDIDTGTISARGTNVSVAATADGHMTTASTLTLDGAGTTTCTLNTGGVTSALTLNNAMATCSTAGAGTITLDSDFTLTTGTFTGGAQNVDLNGAFVQSGGTFTAPSANLNVSGGWTHTAGGTFTHNSGTVIFDGGATSIDVSTNETFSALTFNPATLGAIKTVANSDTLIATGTLTLTEGQVNQTTVPSTGTLAARAAVSQASTFDGGTGTLVIDGTVAQTFTGDATGTLPAVTINKSSGTATLGGSINLGTSALTVSAGTLDQGASYNISAGSITIATGATLSNSGTGDITLAGNLSNAGTLSLDGGGGGAGGADSIAIRSSANGTQRTWSGAGTFTVRDVDLQDQAVDSTSPRKVYANSCTNTGNNSRFSFNVPAIPSISMVTVNETSLSNAVTTFYPPYGGTLIITFTSTDTDGSLDTVTLSTPTLGAGAFFAATAANPGTGTYIFSSTNAAAQGTVYTFTVRATDDNTAISTADLEIMIVAPAAPPPAPAPPPASAPTNVVTVQPTIAPTTTPVAPTPTLPKPPVAPKPLYPGGIDLSKPPMSAFPTGIDLSNLPMIQPPVTPKPLYPGGIDLSKPPMIQPPTPATGGIDISSMPKPTPPQGIDISSIGKPIPPPEPKIIPPPILQPTPGIQPFGEPTVGEKPPKEKPQKGPKAPKKGPKKPKPSKPIDEEEKEDIIEEFLPPPPLAPKPQPSPPEEEAPHEGIDLSKPPAILPVKPKPTPGPMPIPEQPKPSSPTGIDISSLPSSPSIATPKPTPQPSPATSGIDISTFGR